MDYGNIFISARQRAAAFKFYEEFSRAREPYGVAEERDYLEEAYRFLNQPAHRDFIEFCAQKEAMTFEAYCWGMEIDVDELVGEAEASALTTMPEGSGI